MTRTIHDYALLEREYISSDISIRQLCENNGIKNWSTVSAQAQKREWKHKREQFKEAAFKADIEVMAQRRAIKLQQTFEDAIDVIDAAFLKMGQNLDRPDYIVSPTDLATLIKSLSLLTGGPTDRQEVRSFNLNADLPPDVLRDIQAAARANGAGEGSVGQSALPVAPGPRQVN